MAFIEGWPHLRGGLYEGFHCTHTKMMKSPSFPVSFSGGFPDLIIGIITVIAIASCILYWELHY